MRNIILVNTYQVPMSTFAASLSKDDLATMTIQSVEQLTSLLQQCHDSDITFVPDDPRAFDAFAARFRPEEARIGWTIGHNVVHMTASADEYAFTAAELARGVPFHGRSRSELPWQGITTREQCLARVTESKRLRLASLDLWPDSPDLENGVTPWKESGWVNAIGLFTWGIAHDASHIEQIQGVLNQLRTQQP